MFSRTTLISTVLFAAVSLLMALPSTAAAQYLYRHHYSGHAYSRSPRPVTGYGSNLHRNFIIKLDQSRAQQGYSVRRRGNILWRR